MATISLNLNAQGIKTGARDAKQSLDSVKQSATSTEAAVVRSGNNMGSAITRMGNMSGAQRFVFQNTANQLGDIAVQASMGTNIFRVLGMQLPQIAGGFAILGGSMGTVLPILGVIAAVGFPIIAMFTSMGGKTKTLAENMDELADSLENSRRALEDAVIPVSELDESFGIFAESIRTSRRELALMELEQTKRDLNGVLKEFSKIDDLAFFKGGFTGALKRLKFGSEEFGGAQRKLAAEFAVTVDEALELTAVLAIFDDPKLKDNPQAMANAYGLLFDALNKLNPTTDEGATAIFKLAKAALAGKENAAELIGQLKDLQELGPLKFEVTEGIAAPKFTGGGRGSVIPSASDILMMGMGGEIVGGPEKKDTKLDREKQKLATFAEQFQPVLTAAADYEETMTKLNRAREIGAITEEQHAQATAVATDKYRIATGELVDYTKVANNFANSLENSIMQLASGTLTVQSAFENMANAVIKELYRVLVVQQIVNGAMGIFGFSRGPSGNFVPTGDVGAFGGQVSPSQGVVVGERGPEVFFPQSKGTLVPNNKLGGGVVVNQNINVTTGVQQTVRAEVLGLMPQIAEASKAAVLDARRRGGAFAGSF